MYNQSHQQQQQQQRENRERKNPIKIIIKAKPTYEKVIWVSIIFLIYFIIIHFVGGGAAKKIDSYHRKYINKKTAVFD